MEGGQNLPRGVLSPQIDRRQAEPFRSMRSDRLGRMLGRNNLKFDESGNNVLRLRDASMVSHRRVLAHAGESEYRGRTRLRLSRGHSGARACYRGAKGICYNGRVILGGPAFPRAAARRESPRIWSQGLPQWASPFSPFRPQFAGTNDAIFPQSGEITTLDGERFVII
jgi:hypothetical protein